MPVVIGPIEDPAKSPACEAFVAAPDDELLQGLCQVCQFLYEEHGEA